jgi:hypothetical protein
MGVTIGINNYVARQSWNIARAKAAIAEARKDDMYGDDKYYLEWCAEQAACEGDDFELSVCCSTLKACFRLCGLTELDEVCGHVNARVLLAAIDASAPSIMETRAASEYRGSGGCHVIDFGMSVDRLDARMARLRVIALEAMEVGSEVCWA